MYMDIKIPLWCACSLGEFCPLYYQILADMFDKVFSICIL